MMLMIYVFNFFAANQQFSPPNVTPCTVVSQMSSTECGSENQKYLLKDQIIKLLLRPNRPFRIPYLNSAIA